MHEVKGAQQEVNKRHSQSIDIINKMSSYMVGYAPEAFLDLKDEQDFVENRNKPGYVQKFAPGFKDHLYQFEGVKYPAEVVALAENASNKINIIMNVNPALLGTNPADQSGVS